MAACWPLEAAGISFLSAIGKIGMLSPGFNFIKTFIKSSLDNYVLPGTATGTEILLVYCHHWKRYLALAASGARYLAVGAIDLSEPEKSTTRRRTIREGHDPNPQTADRSEKNTICS